MLVFSKRNRGLKVLVVALGLSLPSQLMMGGSALAFQSTTESQIEELAKMKAMLDEQQAFLDNQRRELEAQWQVLESQQKMLEEKLSELGIDSAPGYEPEYAATVQLPARQHSAPPPPQPATTVAAAPANAPAPRPKPPEPVRVSQQNQSSEGQDSTSVRPKSERQVDQLLVDQGGILLPPGVLQVEPSFEYTAVSSDRVNVSGFTIFDAIVIGTIRVDDVNRDIVSTALTVRRGIRNRMQMEVRVPVVYRKDTEITGVGTGDIAERSFDAVDIGDVSATLSWQPFSANGWRPATILRVTGEFPTGESAFEIDRLPVAEDSPETVLERSPTGSGFYTLSGGATFVWPVDPVVLYAGGGYTHAFNRSFDGFGEIEPGAGYDWFAGMNLSLNNRVSTNFSFLSQHRQTSKQEGQRLFGTSSHDARLAIGSSISLTDRASLVMSAQAGLTEESPDFAFSIRLPITLN